MNAIRNILTYVSLIIRLPILVLWLPLCLVTDLLFMIPLISGLVIRPIMRPLISLLGLWILGIFPNPFVRMEDFRRLRMKKPNLESMQNGNQVLTPFYGFLDILVHSVVTRPTAFTIPLFKKDGFVTFHSVLACMWAASTHTITGTPSTPPKGAVVFIHSVPSNGQGILKIENPERFSILPRFQIYKINYYNESYGIAHLVDSPFRHLVSIMTLNWFVTCTVVGLPEPIQDDVKQIGQILSRMTESCHETLVEESDFFEFKKYWNETQNVKYVK